MKPAYSGLVVIDVDGVIYRDIFLRRIVQSKGLLSSLRILSLGVDYYLNRIPLDTLLADGYRLADAFEVRKAHKIAGRIKKVANINYTVDVLHDRGYFVSLISAGIPDFILTNLAAEIGADHSRGMNIEIKDGNFEVGTIRIISKVETVEQLLGEIGLSWNEVVSIGDDPNNIELLKRSGLGIGWNPVRSVREHSDVVIEGTDLSEILPYILPEESLPKGIRKERYFRKRELFRKGVHLLGCFFPFLARSNKTFAVSLLGAVMFLYVFSELLRSRGIPNPAVSRLTRMARRHTEHGGIITGPLLLRTRDHAFHHPGQGRPARDGARDLSRDGLRPQHRQPPHPRGHGGVHQAHGWRSLLNKTPLSISVLQNSANGAMHEAPAVWCGSYKCRRACHLVRSRGHREGEL